jgi:hypothetical protein
MDKIIAAFAAVGLVLDFFPANEDFRDLWQYDGFGKKVDVVVQLSCGINGLNREGIFGTYTAMSGKGWDLSCCKADWLENFGKDIAAIAQGKDLSW